MSIDESKNRHLEYHDPTNENGVREVESETP